MRQPDFTLAFALRPYAPLCCILAVLLCGCCLIPGGGGQSLVATLTAGYVSPVSFKTTFNTRTVSIRFDGFEGQMEGQRLRICVVNRGRSGLEIGQLGGWGGRPDSTMTFVKPGNCVELWNGEIANMDSLHFSVGAGKRIRCEFLVEVSNPKQLRNEIRVWVDLAGNSF